MKKAILMAVQPQHLEKILNGEKTIEIRKTIPKCDFPIDVYLYCCKSNVPYPILPKDKKWGEGYLANNKVVAKFTLNKWNYGGTSQNQKIYNLAPEYIPIEELLTKSCLTKDEMATYEYTNHKVGVFAWNIDNLQIFDKPMELSDFDQECEYKEGYRKCNKCPFFVVESNESIGHEEYCNRDTDRMMPLLRAPQSWQYVYVEENK